MQIRVKYHELSHKGIDKDGTQGQRSIEQSDDGGRENQHMELEQIKTRDQVASLFIKGACGNKFKSFCH